MNNAPSLPELKRPQKAVVLEVKLFNLHVITTDKRYIAKNVTGHNPHYKINHIPHVIWEM
jgi:hypothetical protein